MAGVGLDQDGEGGGVAAHALGADVELVGGCEQAAFHVGVIRITVGAVDRAEQGFFGQQAGEFEVAADADADDEGRAGVGSGLPDGIDDEGFDAFGALRGGEHGESASVFAAAAFEHDGELELIAWDKGVMDDGGRVVAGVDAFSGWVGDHAFSEEAVGVTGGDALVDGVDEAGVGVFGWGFNGQAAALLDEDDGYAGVLAERDVLPFGDLGVFEGEFEEVSGLRVGFGLGGSSQGGQDVGREAVCGFDAETFDSFDHLLILDCPHSGDSCAASINHNCIPGLFRASLSAI